jgi:hypothetical protein
MPLFAPRKQRKTPRECAAFFELKSGALYFEIDRLNMRLIFSLVASTAD